jgi:uncharacterized protein YuzE
MFSKFKKAAKAVEDKTGIDVDGDGKAGDKKAKHSIKDAKKLVDSKEGKAAINRVEGKVGQDIDQDGKVAGKKK